MRVKLNGRALLRCTIIFCLLLMIFVPCRAERRERHIDGWRPVNYDVALVFDDKLMQLTSARADITVLILKDSLSTIDLDFGELRVESVQVGDAAARFEQSEGKLNVQLAAPASKGQQLTVSVKYSGRPKDGLVFAADKSGKASVTGDNWPDRVHHWIPCLDHPSAKATVRFTVTAPARELVVANGQLSAKRDNADDTRTWIYNEGVPIPPYCMVIAVGEFALLEAQPQALTPLFYYVPQTDRQFAPQGFAPAAQSVALFSQRVAPYPYEKLALIVGATKFGGMENSSAIVFPSTIFVRRNDVEQMSTRYNIRRGIVDVVSHEIAHQWFGDSVTEATWSDLWLSEGFATYFAGLFIEQSEGTEIFRRYMQEKARAYLEYEKERSAPIFDPDTEDLNKLLNANNYEKGAWVLHMLRSQLGDEKFFRGIHNYYTAHISKNATTEDLRAALEEASGTSLRDFFQRWVYQSGHPRYEASWWQSRGKVRELSISLIQRQADAAFPNLFPVEIKMKGGSTTRVIISPTGKETIKKITLPRPVIDVRFDPDETILKEYVSPVSR
ncbi:MAG TPA: M1 family metallopeptidase [Pyrinomonadaceae bacterium]